MITLPTVAQLNQLTTSQNALLMLRVLSTSDLSWMSDCFKPESMKDVASVCKDFLEADGDSSGLTDEEVAEFNQLLSHISPKE